MNLLTYKVLSNYTTSRTACQQIFKLKVKNYGNFI